MQDTKLIQALQNLSNKEIQKLYDYLASPFFFKSEDVVALYNALKSFIGKWDSPKLQNERIFAKIFPNKPYNSDKFYRICFDAVEVFEKFYAHYTLNLQDLHANLGLIHYYNKSNLYKHTEALLKSIANSRNKKVIREDAYYYQSWLHDVCALQLSDLVEPVRGKNQAQVSVIAKQFDIFFIAKKLEYICLSYSNRAVLNQEIAIEFEEGIIAFLEKHPDILNKEPFINTYYQIFLMLKLQNPEKQADILNEILVTNKAIFPKPELVNLFTYIQNFFIGQINQGNFQFEGKLLANYKSQLATELVYGVNGEVIPSTMKNIVTLALRLGETIWVREFILTYGAKLQEDIRQNVVNYSLAQLSFKEKSYRDTLKYLSQTDPTDVFFNLGVRRLQIQTYIELEEWELAQGAVNTFRVFLHRDKQLSDNRKESYRNFCTFSVKIADNIYDVAKLQKLQEDILKTSVVNEKKWLLEKISQYLAQINSTKKGHY